MTEPPLDPPNYGPSYPDDPYGSFQPPPAQPPPGPPAAAAAKVSFADRVGARVRRRPEPRFGVALAGIGILLMIFGILVWAGSYAGSGGGGGGGGSDSHKLLGIALSLVAVAAGYILAITQRTGPLVTAGVAASAVGLPVLMGFLSYSTSDSSGFPFSVDAVAIVSIVVWLISYFFVPVVRGHVFYLGASAVLLWIYVLDKAESHLFSFGFLLDRFLLGAGNGVQFGGGGGGIDPNNIAALSLVFGLAYYLIAAILDRNGRSGTATAFAVGGFPATVVGLIAAAVNMPQVGEGFLIIAIGVLVAATAGRGRRFTMWAWTFAIAVGITVILEKLTPDNDTVAGISFIVIGLVVVGLAAAYAAARNEPDETVSTVSE